MFARNAILIDAPPHRIYEFASQTERWPEYLPHYRFVRVLEERGDRRTVEMAARRSGIPVRWRAEQINDDTTPSIHFHHTWGWTRGMDVQWRFEPQKEGTLVSIEHRAALPFPLNWIAGRMFVEHIANKTLRCMKQLAES